METKRKPDSVRQQRIRAILGSIIWEYDIDPGLLQEVLEGKRKRIGTFDRESILVRALERLPWYDLVELLGMEELRRSLTPRIIARLRHRELRERYEFARQVLQGEPVSFAGWSLERRQELRNTLLSDRWYRA